jgi:hypothetical protein
MSPSSPAAVACNRKSPTWSASMAVTQERVPGSPASQRAQSALV